MLISIGVPSGIILYLESDPYLTTFLLILMTIISFMFITMQLMKYFTDCPKQTPDNRECPTHQSSIGITSGVLLSLGIVSLTHF